jgi:hypothetical protein
LQLIKEYEQKELEDFKGVIRGMRRFVKHILVLMYNIKFIRILIMAVISQIIGGPPTLYLL